MAGLELVSDAGFRADGRRPDELRKVRARLGVLARADGSAYLEQGNTKVLAAVYGPHEVSGVLQADGARGLYGILGIFWVLQADGGELGATVSAAGLALLDAGVALRGAVVAGSAGLAEPQAGPPLALSDLSAAEEAAGGPRLVVATVAGGEQLALCQLSARLHHDRLGTVLDAARAACHGLRAVLDSVVRARLRQDTAMEQ
ncbi:PREDICTED: exosome complex component RRP41 [Sturnus vulgaris]|uniref:exosome complex component RRP41 n=1 Tax=Sturnus vulgaris TaxID=9172 RepID=UPI00071A2035|nr:PREDICTED: exosome complex component RRP41 [Sturnus vulgaris]